MFDKVLNTKAALYKYSYKKVLWKYTANLENTHVEVWFQ